MLVAISAAMDAPAQMLDVPTAILNAPSSISDVPFEMMDPPSSISVLPSATPDAPSGMAEMASQMPKTSKNVAFAPAAMGNGQKGMFWAVSAMTDGRDIAPRCPKWGARASRLRRSTSSPNTLGKCSQRDVANGDRDGRAPHSTTVAADVSPLIIPVGRASPLPAARTQQNRRARSDAPYQNRILNSAGATCRVPHGGTDGNSFPEFILGWTTEAKGV